LVLALVRALVIAVLGALAGGCCMVLAFSLHPAVTFDMSRASPREVASGFYPPERAGELTFAWTSRRADVKLAGLNRATEWRCAVRLRGGRGPELPLPRVDVAADGLSVAERTVTNTFEDVPFTVVPRPAPGLSLSITSVPTFVPGPSDTRELGVMVDGLECRPEGRLVLPPRGPLQNAVLASAAFGAALGIVCTTLGGAAAVTLVVSAGQAFLLSIGAAPYSAYSRTLLQFAVSIATLMVLTVKVLELGVGEQGRRAARFIVIFSAAVLYLKILGLLHPSKLLADALFHAHRLEWVLAGRYFFTQPMPSGVSFPYAIGLYVFAAPWASLTSDHVTLLRVVVCVSDALAGAMLYLAIVKIWKDRLAAALAVVLYNVVPLTYGLLSDANLTNLFAQSVALVALMATAVLPLESRKFVGVGVLFSLFALAFLSHISTFAILSITLVALGALSLWKGGEFRHRRAMSLLAATVLAALFSVVTYYGHFTEVFATALRARTQTAATSPRNVTSPVSAEPSSPGASSATRASSTPLTTRIARAWVLTSSGIGWPILVLAAAGLWRLWLTGLRDRLTIVLAAWGLAYLGYLGVGTLLPVGPEFERYAAEFVGRVNLASYPAAVVLAGAGGAWAWRSGTAMRVATVILLLLAVAGGVRHWADWIL
jgi:hypothetical protein